MQNLEFLRDFFPYLTSTPPQDLRTLTFTFNGSKEMVTDCIRILEERLYFTPLKRDSMVNGDDDDGNVFDSLGIIGPGAVTRLSRATTDSTEDGNTNGPEGNVFAFKQPTPLLDPTGGAEGERSPPKNIAAFESAGCRACYSPVTV